MSAREPHAVLVRHAETEWTLSGQHTGRTDIALTDRGREAARELAAPLSAWSFARVLCSPLQRAVETCGLCGLGERAERKEELQEWDYGDYEGLTSAEIEQRRPGWSLWRDGCPGGEHPADVGARADRVVAELLAGPAPIAVFSHGHFLRVLGARWIELAPAGGARLGLSPGSLSLLGSEHEARILAAWNVVGG
jgi:probable phosphoglycerate mutase